MPSIFVIGLLTLAGQNTSSGASIAQELTDIHRGMHAKCMGYLDAGQIQDLHGAERAEHSAYGNLIGFQETRRLTAILMGPDSAAVSRIGLMGSYQVGGWTRDVYLYSPPGIRQEQTRWAAGIAGARTDQDWYALGGWVHRGPLSWKDSAGYRVSGSHDDLFGSVRWHRYGALTAIGLDGFRLARLSFLADPVPFGKYERNWFWPQVEGSVVYNRAAWNPWSDQDAFGAEALVPVLGDRLAARLAAGSDGFRLAQVVSNLDPQGNVGLDVSWSNTRAWNGVGLRFRAPLLTFSWNDPDDVAAFGVSHRGMVWSIRLQMTWERSEMWYKPGRRPDEGGSL
ncbi:MAG: hypothetical protein RL173_2541 [Fibrobacterota bacterium]|jgi:hypothetical protein